MHDSNVNAGPSNVVVPGGVIDPTSLRQSDWGAVLQAGITHTWSDPKPVRIDESTSRFSWTSQASLYHRAYQSLDDFNLTVLTLATGPGLQFQNGDRANLNLQVDDLSLGGNALAIYSSLSPSYTWRVAEGELTASGEWVHRSFRRPEDAFRTGEYRSGGLAYGHLFMGGKLAAQGGITLFNEATRTDDSDPAFPTNNHFCNTGKEIFAGLRYRAWSGGDVFSRLSWRHTRYGGLDLDPVTLDESPRHEIERRVEVGASHRFTDGQLDKWQLAGTVSYVDNSATIGVYEYQRTISMVTLGRSF
jgi:hypothetical protein